MAANVVPHRERAHSEELSGEIVVPREDLAGMLAHDLKTPLAAVAMNLEYVLSPELPAQVAGALRSALEDCQAANAQAVAMVNDMADAANLASGQMRPTIGDVDAAALLALVVRRAAPEASKRGLRVAWRADGPLLRADEALLARAMERLVERCLRRARTGDAIEIALHEGIVTIRLVPIAGSEAASNESPRAAARALGPFFAEAAMRAQGGSLWLESEGSGGIAFHLALPRG